MVHFMVHFVGYFMSTQTSIFDVVSYRKKVGIQMSEAQANGGRRVSRRHLLVKARCLDKQIQKRILLASWGIEPQLANADARRVAPS